MPTNSNDKYEGSCFCGAVRVTASGAPFLMGYCHCSDCRAWSAAPVNGFTLWKREDVLVEQGATNLATYKKTERSHRQFCTKCGGHVMSDHPGDDFIDVFAAILPTLVFQPEMHVHCGESVLSVKDDLPKFKDLPSEFGGSGEEVAD